MGAIILIIADVCIWLFMRGGSGFEARGGPISSLAFVQISEDKGLIGREISKNGKYIGHLGF